MFYGTERVYNMLVVKFLLEKLHLIKEQSKNSKVLVHYLAETRLFVAFLETNSSVSSLKWVYSTREIATQLIVVGCARVAREIEDIERIKRRG